MNENFDIGIVASKLAATLNEKYSQSKFHVEHRHDESYEIFKDDEEMSYCFWGIVMPKDGRHDLAYVTFMDAIPFVMFPFSFSLQFIDPVIYVGYSENLSPRLKEFSQRTRCNDLKELNQLLFDITVEWLNI